MTNPLPSPISQEAPFIEVSELSVYAHHILPRQQAEVLLWTITPHGLERAPGDAPEFGELRSRDGPIPCPPRSAPPLRVPPRRGEPFPPKTPTSRLVPDPGCLRMLCTGNLPRFAVPIGRPCRSWFFSDPGPGWCRRRQTVFRRRPRHLLTRRPRAGLAAATHLDPATRSRLRRSLRPWRLPRRNRGVTQHALRIRDGRRPQPRSGREDGRSLPDGQRHSGGLRRKTGSAVGAGPSADNATGTGEANVGTLAGQSIARRR